MTPKPPQSALRLRSVFISDVHLGFKGCRAEFLLDFLRRVDGEPSALGSWRYEVADTKLARSAKAKFLVQLAFYSALLAKAEIPRLALQSRSKRPRCPLSKLAKLSRILSIFN